MPDEANKLTKTDKIWYWTVLLLALLCCGCRGLDRNAKVKEFSDLRHERERGVLYRPESAASYQRWRIDHPRRFSGKE